MLSKRSRQAEMLDDANVSRQDLYQNLRELHFINANLGGYKASGNAFKTLLSKRPNISKVIDIGFGGGDFIKHLAHSNDQIFFYGIDLKADCVNYAQTNLRDLKNKKLICSNYKNLREDLLHEIDLIHCSLFLHHCDDDEIVDLFKLAKRNHCILLINDLHRHWLAYYSIKLLTALFSKSKLVKNDAPLSVKRGFKRKELEDLLQKAEINNYQIKWNWAFRYTITANVI